MKKKIAADLISIAHRILQLKDHATLLELQEEAKQLYDTLTILHFAETHFAGSQPTIGQIHQTLEEQLDKKTTAPITIEKDQVTIPEDKNPTTLEAAEVLLSENIHNTPHQKQAASPTPVQEIQESEATIPETTPEPIESTIKPETPEAPKELLEESPAIEKNTPEFVIDQVNADISEDLFIPAATNESPSILHTQTIAKNPIAAPSYQKNDKEDIAATTRNTSDRPKSLNDTLKKNITIGLNDRLAFIKHLFDGSSADYNRVLSQLNTINNSQEATTFIQSRVKPDYNHWEHKGEYELRFMEIINARFD